MPDDYKKTLNLPETAFPMRAQLSTRELEILSHWKNINIYQNVRANRAGREAFILHDGPPYANARPHLGTALNKILKDIVVKSKILSGYDAPFIPVWDCHGLPIELNVEKKIGKKHQAMSAADFRSACREYAQSQVELQKEDFERLGVLGDWEHPALTLDSSYEANAIRALGKMIEQGHLSRGQKPVHWCVNCSSALAEAEVEYQEKVSPAIDVAFFVSLPDEKTKILDLFQVKTKAVNESLACFPIWTTTPWTLPANEAVALHPNMDYVLLSSSFHEVTTYFVVLESLATEIADRYGLSVEHTWGPLKGSTFEGISLRHPLFSDRTVPIIMGEHVTTGVGTGNVHTAPAHGLEDYDVGKQYALPVKSLVDTRGCFIEDLPELGGQFIFKANEQIIAALSHLGTLLHKTTIQHSYPHCWRHKTPLIFRATAQWFIAMDKKGLRAQALQCIQSTQWMPERGQLRIESMIAARPDWCISRQRRWGIPLPLLIHQKTGNLHPNTFSIIEFVSELIEKNGIEAWFDLDIKSLAEALHIDLDHYEKVKDTLDVWFDSGVSHFCVLAKRPELHVPADLYLEGSDQHRGWFQASLLTRIAMGGDSAPYNTVLTHGFVVDAEGRKMSKSLGNTILPSDVVKSQGADILRLWVASVDHTVDIHISQEILKRISDAYRRIRNTARFLLSNLYDFNPDMEGVPISDLVAIDRFMITRVIQLQQKVEAAYSDYKFATIYQAILNFCTVDMGNFYLDVIKDRLYTAAQSGLPRRSGQTALSYILEILVRLLAPILSFTAEEIWQFMPGKARSASVFLAEWYNDVPAVSLTKMEQEQWSLLLLMRDEVNKVIESQRQLGAVRSALSTTLTLYMDHSLRDKIGHFEKELRFLFITSEVLLLPPSKQSSSAIATSLSGLAVCVEPATDKKCARCWHHRADVGASTAYPDWCGRCVVNLEDKQGEVRQFI